jgi:hypothetical protein
MAPIAISSRENDDYQDVHGWTDERSGTIAMPSICSARYLWRAVDLEKAMDNKRKQETSA